MSDADPIVIVYLNGRFIPASQAMVSAQDRGLTFSDGVYEVVRYNHGKAFDIGSHMARLRRSLTAVRLSEAIEGVDLHAISDVLVRRNNCPHAKLYWQLTRGHAWRDHEMPDDAEPTVFLSATPMAPVELDAPVKAHRCIWGEDVRWHRCDIKSLMLMPNILALEEARQAGADDAIFVRDGVITESTSRNVLIVKDGALRTHPANTSILHGATRRLLIEIAGELGIRVFEEAFSQKELLAADEVLLCSTTSDVIPVARVDGQDIRDGEPGPMTLQLLRALRQRIMAQTA